MKRATVVIGAAFGDEGKGLLTDYFCRQAADQPMVVRFNGGAQAGHTVVTPQGDRHVFHHYGAGTLAGARTYLSRYFLVNPVLWREEYEQLQGKHLRTRLFVDREAPLTTVYDMMSNQRLERARAKGIAGRHGSCGAGINATMNRQRQVHYRLFAGDLERPGYLRSRVERLRDVYMGQHEMDTSDAVLERFLKDCALLAEQINLCDSRILDDWNSVVFEGAQGLLLDQCNAQFFPHVTHSRTGLHNVIKIANETGIEQLDTHYVMRSYLTRHGAGPLPLENPELSYHDNTNVENEWQGKLRFAPLIHGNADMVLEACYRDYQPFRATGQINITPRFVLTHCDQHDPDTERFSFAYTTHGPTADDVSERFRR